MDVGYSSDVSNFIAAWREWDGVAALCPDQLFEIKDNQYALLSKMFNESTSNESLSHCIQSLGLLEIDVRNALTIRNPTQVYRISALFPKPLFQERGRPKHYVTPKIERLISLKEMRVDIENEEDKRNYFKVLMHLVGENPSASVHLRALGLDKIYSKDELYELARNTLLKCQTRDLATIENYGFNLDDPQDQNRLFKLAQVAILSKAPDFEFINHVDKYLNFKESISERYLSYLIYLVVIESPDKVLLAGRINSSKVHWISSPTLERFNSILGFIAEGHLPLHLFGIPNLDQALSKVNNKDEKIFLAIVLLQYLGEENRGVYEQNMERFSLISRLVAIDDLKLRLKVLDRVQPLLGVENILEAKVLELFL